MKSSTKIILASVCTLLVLVGAIAATLALMMDDDSAINTFAVGKVDIKLDEAAANSDGTLIEGAERVKANDFHLLPGRTYNIDPTVSLLQGSEDSYIRMLVTVNKPEELKAIYGSAFKPTDIAGGYDEGVWQYVTEKTNSDGSVSYEYRYYERVCNISQNEFALTPIIKTITVTGDIDNAQIKSLSGLRITFEAHAIQASGFEGNVNDAWIAFDEKMN